MIQHIIDKPWISLALLLVLIFLYIGVVIRMQRENRLKARSLSDHGEALRPKLVVVKSELKGQAFKTHQPADQEINDRFQDDRRRSQSDYIETLKSSKSRSNFVS